MNMFKAVKAKTIKEYLEMLQSDRKESIEFLHNFIQKTAPSLKPHFAYNMLGYGSFSYKQSFSTNKNHKKEIVEWPTIALANQKNYISLYICALENGQYLAEKYKSKLGKVSVGKSCIRFKKIEDLNLKTFEKVLKIAEKSPGFIV